MKDVRHKAHILCDSIHMNLLEKANLYRQKADWWLSEAEGMGNGNQLLKSFWISFFFSHFFLFVVNFVIHWNKTAMGLHVFPIKVMKIFWNDIEVVVAHYK